MGPVFLHQQHFSAHVLPHALQSLVSPALLAVLNLELGSLPGQS